MNNLFDNSCDQVQIGSLFTSCLLYADDLVLLSTSDKGLQVVLDKLSSFCFKWNLKVNISKTKVIIFNKAGKTLKGYKFKYEDSTVDIVNDYKYLGIIFTASGTCSEGINYLCKKALKALFRIRKALASEKTNQAYFLNYMSNVLNQFCYTVVRFGLLRGSQPNLKILNRRMSRLVLKKFS